MSGVGALARMGEARSWRMAHKTSIIRQKYAQQLLADAQLQKQIDALELLLKDPKTRAPPPSR